MKITFDFLGEKQTVSFIKDEYVNGGIYIGCVCDDEEPWCDFSVCIPMTPLGENEIVVDVNSPSVPEIARQLVVAGMIKETGDTVSSGYVVYPIYELTQTFLDECK